jgi:ATP-dependent Clp protease ATP-binding subunit ClpA
LKKVITVPFTCIRYRNSDGMVWLCPVSNIRIHWPEADQKNLLLKQREGWQAFFSENQDFLFLGLFQNVSENWKKDQLEWIPDPDLIPEAQSLPFPLAYVYQKEKQGCLGIIPSFRILAWGTDTKDMRDQLAQKIRQNLQALPSSQRLGALLSGSGVQILGLETLSLALSLERKGVSANEGRDNDFSFPLEKAVTEILPHQPLRTRGFQTQIQDLLPLFESPPYPSLLIVGPSGSGKTTLLRELSEVLRQRDPQLTFFESHAGQLLQGLTQDWGWEHNLPLLQRELADRKGILLIHHARDLLQVGQYEGNSTSLADGMKEGMKAGDWILFAECTPEELRWMENRAPDFVRLFYKTKQVARPEEFEQLILKNFDRPADRTGNDQALAVRELLGLQSRFEPYSGQPGRAIRFLESYQKEYPDQPLNAQLVRQFFARQSGIPLLLLDPEVELNRTQIESRLQSGLFGQPAAIEAVTSTLLRLKAGLLRERKPVASFLFVGPTGVGKTELAKQLAEFIFGTRKRLIRFDMSEFADRSAAIRLIGHGYRQEGLLTGQVRKEPFSVLLLDEIEKGNPRFLDLLLQILGDGRVTDEEGITTDFGGTVIILTSNIGADRLSRKTIGWEKEDGEDTRNRILETELLQRLRPELLNRIDEVVPFRPLSQATVRQVFSREWAAFLGREGVRPEHIEVDLSGSAENLLLEKSFDPKYGARQLQRTLRQYVYLPLAERLRLLDLDEPTHIQIDARGEWLYFQVRQEEVSFPELLVQWERIVLADQVSAERRLLDRVSGGPVWEKLSANAHQHQWEAERKGFSSSGTEAVRLQKRFQELRAGVEALEKETALKVLQRERQVLDERLDRWKREFEGWGREVLQLFQPDTSTCHLIILGRQTLQVGQWYEQLLQDGNWTYRFFQRKPKTHSKAEPTDWDRIEFRSCSELGQRVESEDIRGIEFEIGGPGSYPFFKPEAGFQKWTSGQDPARTYAILVQNESYIPKEAHRKTFFLKKPVRRSMTRGEMNDHRWTKDRIPAGAGQQEWILDLLKQEFSNYLQNYLLTGKA